MSVSYTPMSERVGWFLWWVVLGVYLVPVWANPYFVTNDLPAHLYNARILWAFLADALPSIFGTAALHSLYDFYQGFYEINPHLTPTNGLVHGLLMLGLPFFSPAVIEKLACTLYLVLMPLSVRYCMMGVQRERVYFASLHTSKQGVDKGWWFWIFPFVVTVLFQRGFLNFSLGSAFAFFAVGFALYSRYPRKGEGVMLLRVVGFRYWLSVSALLLLTFLAHPLPFVVAGIVIGVWWILNTVRAFNTTYPQSIIHHAIGFRSVYKWVLTLAPALGSLLWFATQNQNAGATSTPEPLDVLLLHFYRLDALLQFSQMEKRVIPLILWVILGGALLAIVQTLQRRTKVTTTTNDTATPYGKTTAAIWVWVVSSVAVFVLYLYAPDDWGGGGYVKARLEPLPYLLFIIGLSGLAWRQWQQGLIAALGLVLSVGLVVCRLPTYQRLSEAATEYSSVFPLIRTGAVVLPLCFSETGTDTTEAPLSEVSLFKHTTDYAGAERGMILLDNYEATTNYFPLVWRTGRSTIPYLADNEEGIEGPAFKINLEQYSQQVGKPIEYVVLWGYRKEMLREASIQDIFAQLNAHYERVYVSPHGRVWLFRRMPT